MLLRGYSLLLTDADAVFLASPFSVFAPQAALSVACDSTVVPKTWREAPGMVIAGLFNLPTSPYISPYLPTSPYISPYLPVLRR